MTTHWIIEGGDGGHGQVTHTAAPRFTAFWTSGAGELAAIDGPCWIFEGSADEDTLHLFGFRWKDPAPNQQDFERLMSRAAAAIDDWIVTRL